MRCRHQHTPKAYVDRSPPSTTAAHCSSAFNAQGATRLLPLPAAVGAPSAPSPHVRLQMNRRGAVSRRHLQRQHSDDICNTRQDDVLHNMLLNAPSGSEAMTTAPPAPMVTPPSWNTAVRMTMLRSKVSLKPRKPMQPEYTPRAQPSSLSRICCATHASCLQWILPRMSRCIRTTA